jgi:hypothetical protein
VREPATSCTTCGAALLPAEVLYNRQADVVCAACFCEAPEPGRLQRRLWWRAGRPRVAALTPHERRGAILRWSLLFAILAAASLQVRHFGLLRLHMICPRVSIDAPAADAAVPTRLVVRGHVVGSAVTRPLWIVAREVGGRDPCLDVSLTPAIADPFGMFMGVLDLRGRRGQRYAVSVVSVDQVVDGELQVQPAWPRWEALHRDVQQQGGRGRRCGPKSIDRVLPEDAAVLASVVVILNGDPPAAWPGSFDADGPPFRSEDALRGTEL